MADEPFTGSDSEAGATDTVHASAVALRSRHPASPIRTSVLEIARQVARRFALGAETRTGPSCQQK